MGLVGNPTTELLVSDFLHACDLSKADNVRERERDTIGKEFLNMLHIAKTKQNKRLIALKYFFHELEDVTLKYRNSTVIHNPE